MCIKKLLKWSEHKIKNLTIWDWAIAKTALILFGMIIGTYVSGFVKAYIGYFIVTFIILYGLLIYKIFCKK